jgi:hypothetical protein
MRFLSINETAALKTTGMKNQRAKALMSEGAFVLACLTIELSIVVGLWTLSALNRGVAGVSAAKIDTQVLRVPFCIGLTFVALYFISNSRPPNWRNIVLVLATMNACGIVAYILFIASALIFLPWK